VRSFGLIIKEKRWNHEFIKEKKWNHESNESDESRKKIGLKSKRVIEMAEILYREEAYAVMGACFEVYNVIGTGFLEAVYQECLEIELGLRGIPFRPKHELELKYKGRILKKKYEPDFVCFEKIILEIKAESTLTDIDRAQVHNYLKATGFRLGLLVNYGRPSDLQYERIIY